MRLAKSKVWWLTLGLTGLGLGGLLIAASQGWPGTPVDCHASPCFCEESSSTWWRQPVNTWSNLAPIGLGLWVAADGIRLPPVSPMLQRLGLLFPLVLAFQGVGSMYFHASLTTWGMAIDAVSMFAIVGLLLGVNLHRLSGLSPGGLTAFLGAFVVAGLAGGLVVPRIVSGLVLVSFISLMATEVLAAKRGKTRSSGWFRGGIGMFVAGVAVWYGSAFDGMPLCWPHSLFQGHGLWHVTSGLAVASFWRHSLANLSVPADGGRVEPLGNAAREARPESTPLGKLSSS